MTGAPVTYCTNCGAHLPDDAHFCGECGHVRLGDDAAAPTDAPTTETPATAATPAPPTSAAPPSPTPTTAPTSTTAATPAAAVTPTPVPAPTAVPTQTLAPTPVPAPGDGGRGPLLVIAGIVAAVALVASLVVIAVALWPSSSGDVRTGSGPEVLCADDPGQPGCATTTSTAPTTTTTTASTTTTTATTAPTLPPVTAAPPPPADQPGDAGASAIDLVSSAVASCGQGGSLGPYSVIELAPGVYRVTVTVTFEGFTEVDTANWTVDFNAANGNLVAEDFAAEWLTCIGT